MNNHFTIQRQLLFTRIMRQSLCLHAAFPNILLFQRLHQFFFGCDANHTLHFLTILEND